MQLEVTIENYKMTPSAAFKWSCFPVDIRAALAYAFDDAIRHIHVVLEHECSGDGEKWEIHRLRIGYAIFEIASREYYKSVITDIEWNEE